MQGEAHLWALGTALFWCCSSSPRCVCLAVPLPWPTRERLDIPGEGKGCTLTALYKDCATSLVHQSHRSDFGWSNPCSGYVCGELVGTPWFCPPSAFDEGRVGRGEGGQHTGLSALSLFFGVSLIFGFGFSWDRLSFYLLFQFMVWYMGVWLHLCVAEASSCWVSGLSRALWFSSPRCSLKRYIRKAKLHLWKGVFNQSFCTLHHNRWIR